MIVYWEPTSGFRKPFMALVARCWFLPSTSLVAHHVRGQQHPHPTFTPSALMSVCKHVLSVNTQSRDELVQGIETTSSEAGILSSASAVRTPGWAQWVLLWICAVSTLRGSVYFR